MTMAFVDANGIRIHYEFSGSDGLPVVVFSHSLGANLGMWEAQAGALAGRFRVLRYDGRGHGESSVPAGPYTAGDLGRDVLGLLDALEIGQANFCGLSMGGVVGQWLGIHAPQRLKRLVLADTAAKIGNEEIWNARVATVEREGLAPVIPGTLERWYTAEFRAAHPKIVRSTEAMLQATSPAGYAACCAALRDTDFRAGLGGVSVPSLVIAGASDPVTTPGDGRFLAGAIAGAQYVELAAAHLSNVEAAEAFNAALLRFLAD
jgi:3-oxoadipate enol-lactonase